MIRWFIQRAALKFSESPTENEDRDGCLSAELPNLRGRYETRWEDLGFLLRLLSEHLLIAIAPPSQKREVENLRKQTFTKPSSVK